MQNKLTSLNKATGLIRPGDTLDLGGITLYRRPVALVCSLIGQRDRLSDLTLLCFTAGYESDLLIGAGMVSTLRSCYCGLEVFGLAPMFTQAANRGELEIIEETEASLSFGIRVKLAGVSFMPGLSWLGTDLPGLRPDVKVIQPGQQLMAFPAISWDVAVIHALKADRSGNALLNGNIGIDQELSLGARDVIITAEEIVEGFDGWVDITGAMVSAVVYAPQGAWPTSCSLAGGEILRYIEACNAEHFEEYLEQFVIAETP